ncbi:F-actin-monooxygenase mical2b isoform X8 [Takifugu flavidus]|uniref:F-actin-monooxygenase mical2b isoform X8 n=1 Tax=Takifugu flavidus TaxID=433684 RepID=UPI0025449C87|nr:F-actin-monooxygenase mical2b isoform X8 [Takifugu flavidus]
MGETEDEHLGQASVLFENFVQASTCKGTLQAFSILCRQLQLDPLDYSNFYSSLKAAVSTWKVKTLWTKLDKKAQQKVYGQNKACQGTRCLIIGGGPCGLRTAIELALLGCKVVLIEKRDTFSRNNVLHLWPFTIHDLRGLGAKKFYGKFCAGSIDHISIRQLQLMLLKVCLILGVEIHVNVEFTGLLEPQKEQPDEESGWCAEFQPSGHPLADFHFDVVIGADGRKSTLDGFARKEFRGKLAIAITANFVNRNTTAEAKVEEISGVAFIFNQKFFLELKEETGIDLENIVYYRDNTHYFVMTAKKQSLLDKGVIISDHIETERLLSADNVNQEALLSYAREAADFGTNYQLPSLDYAINHYGQPDVAMFDFTCMYASENATLIREKRGHQLVVALVGDSLLEPFWPMGTGCARGFLAAFDTAWMVRGWAQGRKPLEILAERESIYRLLPQTTPENISKNFEQYSIDPVTRYPNLNVNYIRPHQVRHLFINGHLASCHLERGGAKHRSGNWFKRESDVHPGRLLSWCQKQTRGYRGVVITDLTSSWRNGLALCALIHHQRPELIDFDSLEEEDVAENNQLAFDIAEREFGIQPVIRGEEMAAAAEPDQLLMVLYLSKFQEAFRSSPANGRGSDANIDEYCAKSKPVNPQPRKRIPRDDKKLEDDSVNKRQRKGNHYLTELSCHSALPAGEDGELRENKVRSMATQLLAKFEENSSTVQKRSKYDEESDLSFSSEEEEEKDNPRFAKPSDAPSPPPFPPSRPRWQPSIYLRLLENPSLVTPQANFLFNAPCLLSESRSPSPSRSESPPCPSVSQQPPPEHPSFAPTVSHDSSSIPSSARSMQQKLSSREFSRKSVKERAVLLSTMFAGFTPSHLRSCDSQCVARKDGAAGLGGSDICHFCSKRVYVMERLSAEGFFFHRECFRCNVCSCTLRLGGHAFDSREAKFYCKIHYAQRQTSSHMGKIRRLEERLHPRLLDSGSCSTMDSIQTGPPGTASNLNAVSKGETRVLEDSETVSATRDASCLVGANPTAKSQIQDSSKAHSNPKQNNRWKEKIRNTFPLIFIKYFQKNLTPDIDGPQTVPEVESSFEDIIAAEETTFADNLKSADGPSKRSLGCNVSAPRKRLMPSVSEKGKLLNWDAVVTTEESTNSPSNSEEQVHAETKADKSQTDSGQKGEPSESQSSASSPSAFQLIANAFRRTFNVTNPSSGSDSAVIMRTKCNSQHRQRPLSEGMLGCPEPCQGERNSGSQETWWATLGADAWGGGRDLPSLLQEVSLKGSRDSSLLFSDVTRQMPRRRVNLFSSLRLRKPGASKSEGQHQEMQKESGMLLTNIRNDASCDPTSQEPSSGDDEEDKTVPSWKLHPERKRRKQEKMVARQARREQLKRLHRAQAIQRQLEEVTEKQRSLEERGVAIEKTIRREAGAESLESGDVVEDQLYRTWFKLVLEKNRLARYESELMIFAQELELEDTQSRLQQDLRQRMATDDTKKSASELQEEQEILSEIMRTVEKRDTLVSLLEEQRLKERAEDRDLESLVLSKGYEFHWAQKDDG